MTRRCFWCDKPVRFYQSHYEDEISDTIYHVDCMIESLQADLAERDKDISILQQKLELKNQAINQLQPAPNVGILGSIKQIEEDTVNETM